MKHVGLNVASDSLMTLAYGIDGGFVLVSADEPECHSSQMNKTTDYSRDLPISHA